MVVFAFLPVVFASASCWMGFPKPKKVVQRLGGQKFNKCLLDRKACQSVSGAVLTEWRWKVFMGQLLLPPSRFSRVRLCATPWTAAYQASPSTGFSRQEHWSGLPFPSPVTAKGKYKLKNPHDRPLSFI